MEYRIKLRIVSWHIPGKRCVLLASMLATGVQVLFYKINSMIRKPDKNSAIISWFTAFVIRRSAWIILCAIVIAALCFPGATKIRLNANVIALLPEDAPCVKSLRRILTKVTGQGDLMVMIESPSFNKSVSYAESLLVKVRRLSWVSNAEFGQDMSFFERNKLLYMNYTDLLRLFNEVDSRIARAKLRHNPLYIDLSNSSEDTISESFDLSELEQKYHLSNGGMPFRYFQNENGTVLIMVIHPKGITSNLPFAKRVHRELKEIAENNNPQKFHPDMKVSIGGTFVNRINEYDTIVNDVRSSAMWVGVAILLLIVLYFKHPVSVVVIFLPLIISLIITFTFAAMFVDSLNIITVFLFIILFGLGIDFGIHLFAQYREERRIGKKVESALQATLKVAGRAALVSALTTALTFMVLMYSSFRGFSEFGIIAGTGLLFSSICYLTVMPAIIVQIENRCSLVPKLIKPYTTTRLSILFRHPLAILLLAAIFTITALSSMKDLQFEYDFRNLRANISSIRDFNRKMVEVFALPRDPALVLVDSIKEANALAQTIRSKIETSEGTETIQSVKTLNDFLPARQREKLILIAKLRKQIDKYYDILPRNLQTQIARFRNNFDISEVTVDALPQYVKKTFLGRDGSSGQLVYIYQKKSLLDLRNALAFSKDVKNIRVEERDYQAAGEPIVYAAMFQDLKEDSIPILILVVIAIAGIVFLDVKKWKHTMLSLFPLMIGILWMFGAMAALGIKLNLLNSVVLPCVLGLGVDGGVHLFHQYWIGPTNGLAERLQVTAKSVAICTATSMVGFGGMITAEHPGLRSIGIVAIIGLSATLAASVILYPSLLMVLSTKIHKQNERK